MTMQYLDMLSVPAASIVVLASIDCSQASASCRMSFHIADSVPKYVPATTPHTVQVCQGGSQTLWSDDGQDHACNTLGSV